MAEGGVAATEAAMALELLRQTGQLSPAQERLMGTVTRSAKAPVTVADLDTEWRRTALGLGVSRERIEVLRHQQIPALEPAAPREVLAALTEFDATFPAREARAVALERSAGAPIDAALEQLRELRARDEILVLADGTGTTRQHRGPERTVVAIALRPRPERLNRSQRGWRRGKPIGLTASSPGPAGGCQTSNEPRSRSRAAPDRLSSSRVRPAPGRAPP
ncbi:MAG: hypothetical protein ACLP0J_10580 [Solirubrobacteraceae bacterium]